MLYMCIHGNCGRHGVNSVSAVIAVGISLLAECFCSLRAAMVRLPYQILIKQDAVLAGFSAHELVT